MSNNDAVRHARLNGHDVGYADACPRAYWSMVTGIERRAAKEAVEASLAVKSPTLADVWPR
jgi:hypothetical protein